ncbi:MAG: hypothetical protein BWX93_01902 [Bacteroidetes bacterium ADurb.Bin139]|nr:MAG: hypothetical protein BWX93_01902 [Bacteroidetes bacterium ADurb.Bin139]
MIRGQMSLPLASGEVSTCAMNPMAGTSLSMLEGMDAITYPYSSMQASATPICRNSLSSTSSKTNCLAVLGCVCDSGSDAVSKEIYRRNLSRIFSIISGLFVFCGLHTAEGQIYDNADVSYKRKHFTGR